MNRSDMPSNTDVYIHWKDYLKKHNKDFGSPYFCFACGYNKNVQRCHINALINSQSNSVDNIHLLCIACHKDSECLNGEDYTDWFINRNISKTKLSACLRNNAVFRNEVVDALMGKMKDSSILDEFFSTVDNDHSLKTRIGIENAKRAGVKIGCPSINKVSELGRKIQEKQSIEFAKSLENIILPLKNQGKSLKEISDTLTSMDIKTARGGKWSATHVMRILDKLGV